MDEDKKVLIPEEFYKRMFDLFHTYNEETAHAIADDLMCDLLETLGYGEGVQLFRDANKWYS